MPEEEDFESNSDPGSKPLALHTEYVEEEDTEDRSYGTQDLVFYLRRADADEGDSGSEDPFGKEGEQGNALPEWGEWDYPDELYGKDLLSYSSSNIGPALDVSGDTGPNADNGSVQSGAQQIGMTSLGRSLGGTNPGGYSMGPMSGMDYNDEEALGAISQNASVSVDVGEAVRNALRSVSSLDSQVTNLGMASSEKMFNGILRRNYHRESLDEEQGTEDNILDSIDRPPTAELAVLLARASGGVTRVRDLAAGINNGTIGVVTPKSRAFQGRKGPNGSPRRR